MEGFPRMNEGVDSVGSTSGLGKSSQDQLKLTRVVNDISNGEDTRCACFRCGGINFDMAVVHIESPSGDGAQVHGQAKKWQ